MTIIVTGGAGFIGSNFIYFQLKNHPEDRIVCLDSLTYAGNMATLDEAMKHANFRFVKADITDRAAVEKLSMTAFTLQALGANDRRLKSGGASVNTAQGYELEAIAGCTIGGVSVNGGVGKISGILIGVLVFELLKIAMQFMGIETSYTYIVQGLVIIIAVALDLRKYLTKK